MDFIAIASAGMQTDLSQLSRISQNLANVSTPGYKRQLQSVPPIDAFMAAAAPDVMSERRAVDPSAGTLRKTGNPLDIAIDGDAFLEVRSPSGMAYTRLGELAVDPQGRLVTRDGFPVMGSGGELYANSGQATINEQGELFDAGHSAGRLHLVRFEHAGALEPIGNGLYRQGGATLSTASETSRVRSGYLEMSNVNSAFEMVQLSETVRHFESLQRVIQGWDDVFGKAMRKLGDF